VSRITVHLEHGLKIGEATHKEIELKMPSAGDVIDASVAAERLVLTPKGGYALVQSPALADFELLKRQIVRIGDLNDVAATDEMVRALHAEDLEALNRAAGEMGRSAMEALDDRGRDNPGEA